jgi:hypothetical protein
LADWIFEWNMPPDPSAETTFGASRNVTVFDELRHIAYREVLAPKRDGSLETCWLAASVWQSRSINNFPAQ